MDTEISSEAVFHCAPQLVQVPGAQVIFGLRVFFFKKKLKYSYCTILYVTGVQYSDSQFLKVILQNIGSIPCAVQYILVPFLFYTL